jgi:hypothetical protein
MVSQIKISITILIYYKIKRLFLQTIQVGPIREIAILAIVQKIAIFVKAQEKRRLQKTTMATNKEKNTTLYIIPT